MSLKDDAKRMFVELLGPEVAKQLDSFDNPETYPKEFLTQCTYFMSQIIGERAAEEKMKPLFEKYDKG